ncbi:hypothetical protein M427DRAFT_54171 [Gonapodya prolifera JEL478]|uniref:Uncharacterized protein n=1 Tax=Gonapodya prolifera (strain JEL478) TaxID=1344416 RepID=A0A139AN35_GONPJ|nr:hypothetical protein M427DRAFT_54171 [Gonapodya prolifera JEL478]|eukprot:KXS17943.1 hypothetical protein M427DRAFT_54171 [Gonapodya prolifera JEL478]
MTDEFSKEIRSLTAELSAISSFDMLCGVSHENERSAEDIEAIQKNIGDVRKGIEMELENQKALATRRLDDLKERTSRILETLKASSQN